MAQLANQALTEQAAQWLSRRSSGQLSPEDQSAFEAWLDASPYHAVAYARVEATWERAQRLQAIPTFVPGLVRSESPEHRWRLYLSWAAAVLVLVAGTATWFAMRPDVYQTDVGERRTVALADGSRVELNTASTLYVDYSKGARNVQLGAGEALFQVAKDPDRPFVVKAGNAAVQAVGTMFNVRLREQDVVEVTVTEGIVAVDGKETRETEDFPELQKRRKVAAGGGALVGLGAVATMVLDREVLDQRTAWQRDVIELRGETLEQAVAEFNRYRMTPLVIGDSRIASLRVGGTFATHESAKFLAALNSGFGVKAVEGAQGTVYLVAAR